MAEKRVLEYIEASLKKGVSRARVMKNLYEAGWPDSDIEDAFMEFPVVPIKPDLISLKRHSNWKLISAGLVLIIIVVFAGAALIKKEKEPRLEQPKASYCGYDIKCLMNSAHGCYPVQGRVNITLGTEKGLGFEIIGKKGSLCAISLIGTQGIGNCTLPAASLTELLRQWSLGNFNEWGEAECKGALFAKPSSCNLKMGAPFIDLTVNGQSNVEVSGYANENSISWSSDAPAIASAEQGRGKSCVVKGNSPGKARLIAKDTSTNCSAFVQIEVR